jgi:hypothetical protein
MRISATLALLVVLAPVRAGRAEEPVAGWTPELAFKVKRVGPVRVSRSRAAFVAATAPTWSPDGKWIAFASARGKAGKEAKEPKPGL